MTPEEVRDARLEIEAVFGKATKAYRNATTKRGELLTALRKRCPHLNTVADGDYRESWRLCKDCGAQLD